MKSKPSFIAESNISRAWAAAFLPLFEPGIEEMVPLSVTINIPIAETELEDSAIRDLLDEELLSRELATCKTVASTIFPLSLWNPQCDRKHLYDRFNRISKRILRFERNKYGHYFSRLISYGENNHNQLERILQVYESGNHRRSALQASILIPEKDINRSRQRGFPCMQQVAFTPYGKGKKKALAITGFFATQYLFERAYGNYLGLYYLGRFIAHELDMPLGCINCLAGVAKLGRSKSELLSLKDRVSDLTNSL